MKKGPQTVLMVILVVMVIASSSYAYYQNSRLAILRKETIWMRQELQRLKKQNEAVRIEASKLRTIVENERKVSLQLREQALRENRK